MDVTGGGFGGLYTKSPSYRVFGPRVTGVSNPSKSLVPSTYEFGLRQFTAFGLRVQGCPA